jgi:hypothetical protein
MAMSAMTNASIIILNDLFSSFESGGRVDAMVKASYQLGVIVTSTVSVP